MSEVKYRHPQEQTLTWSGRGRAPKWFEAALQMGFSEAALLVANQIERPAEQNEDIDLGIGETPTLAETLYAQCIVAGQTPEPSAGDPTYSTGTQVAVAQLRNDADAPVSGEVTAALPATAQENRDLLNQLLGQAQAFSAASGLLRTFGVSKLAFVKENKLYRELSGLKLRTGSESLAGTWEEFCGLLGMSVDKVDTDIANLRAFGEEALESMSRMGIGYRELRQFRKLPADQREALAQIAVAGTKDDVLEAAYEAIEAERAKRSALEVQNAELSEDLKVAERRGKNLDAEIERQEMKIKKLSSARQRCTEFLERTEDIRAECMALQFGVELHLNSLRKLFDDTDVKAPEGLLQQETLWIVATTALARALDLVEHMHDLGAPEAQPDRPMTRHLLTPEEAIRWMQDYPLIENRFAAEQAMRQEKRDAAKPKKPGRPKVLANRDAEE